MKLTKDIVKLASKADRIALVDDISRQTQINVEADLHEVVSDMLHVRGIKFVHSRMDQKTTQEKGVPDFLFVVRFLERPTKADPLLCHPQSWPVGIAWELKIPGKTLDPDQKQMFDRLTTPPNAWCCRCIHSVQEALAELRRLGL